MAVVKAYFMVVPFSARDAVYLSLKFISLVIFDVLGRGLMSPHLGK